MWIIEAVDVLAKCRRGLGSCLIACSPDQFSFDCFEDGLDHGVVVTITLATHLGRSDCVIAEACGNHLNNIGCLCPNGG